MTWEKRNLVTIKDKSGTYDEFVCSKCGFRKKYYGLFRDPGCPKGCDKEDELGYADKVYGFWTTRAHVGNQFCQKCKGPCIEVPLTGHVNSVYWRLKRFPDEVLMCCADGCHEKGDGSYHYLKKSKAKLRRIEL